ncbi:MAG TPA: hypothetical protein DCP71_02490 [Verrucomicrobiales bacterium]|nr:hypothetical protein [Verrucomicrobiales bacterium]
MVIEVATRHEMDTLMAAFAAWSPGRPVTTLDFTPSTSPEKLFTQARQTVEGWPESLGLLALAGTNGESTPEETDRFWSQMNQMREKWDSLQAQIIFFLLPRQYRSLSSCADHLKRWIPVKAHLLSAKADWDDSSLPISDIGPHLLSPQTARQTIQSLESQLVQALQSGTPQDILVSRFYLPLFTAAISLGDLGRTKSLLEKIRPHLETLTDEMQAPWWPLLFEYYLNTFQIEESLKTANLHYHWSVSVNDLDEQAIAANQMGTVNASLRDFAAAERWYRKSLAIFEKQGNEQGAASTYHQLGILAQEQRDFAAAERWYLKSLAIKEKQGNEQSAASTYHQMGFIAQEQRDFAAAERWYLKSLVIKEKQENERGVASSYHQLGRLAEEQRDFAAAERWYLKSLAIKEKQGNEHGAASSYHQLGRLAQEQRDYAAAERWYLKSLAIREKQGNEHGAAITYHQLGMIAEEQRDFAAAERCYLKSLVIEEKQGDEQGAARTYHQLGRLAEEQLDYAAAESWYRKSLSIEEKQGNERGAAITYHQLGRLAEKQNNFSQASFFFLKAFHLFHPTHDQHNKTICLGSMVRLIRTAAMEFRPQVIKQLQESLGQELAQKVVEVAQSPA